MPPSGGSYKDKLLDTNKRYFDCIIEVLADGVEASNDRRNYTRLKRGVSYRVKNEPIYLKGREHTIRVKRLLSEIDIQPETTTEESVILDAVNFRAITKGQIAHGKIDPVSSQNVAWPALTAEEGTIVIVKFIGEGLHLQRESMLGLTYMFHGDSFKMTPEEYDQYRGTPPIVGNITDVQKYYQIRAELIKETWEIN